MWTGAFRYQLPGTSKYAKPVSIHLEAAQRTEAIRGADTWIRKQFPALPKYIHQQMWKSAPFRYDNVTDAQLKALRRYKIEIPSKITKGQAMVLLTKLQFGQLAIWKNQIDQNIKLKKAEKKKQTVAVLSRKHDHVRDYYHHE